MRKLLVLFIIVMLTVVGVVSAQENETYTVRSGDTLTGIANAYDVDIDAILIANNIIDPNSIRVGQVLIIPTGAVTVPRTHVVQPGENLTDIATRYNTTVEALIDTNNLAQPDSLVVGQVITLPATGGPATFPRTYRLDIGDTLRSVGEQFGVTWQQIAAYNNIANPNYVEAGLLIQIPPVDYVVPTTTTATGGAVTTTAPATTVVTQPTTVTYVVQQGDVLDLIAQRFGVTIESLRAYNNLAVSDAIFAGDVLIIPPTGGVSAQTTTTVIPRTTVNGYYTVRAGDTMFAIAASFNVNVYTLAQANGILNLNSIYAGQFLYIPGY